MTQHDNEDRQVRPLADFLAEHNKGAQHRQISEMLQEVVGAVVDTGKKGSLVITIGLEPVKNAEPGTLQTTISGVPKIPALPARAAIFYADEDNNLRREDPRQPAFEGLKDVSGPEVKDGPSAPRVVGGDA